MVLLFPSHFPLVKTGTFSQLPTRTFSCTIMKLMSIIIFEDQLRISQKKMILGKKFFLFQCIEAEENVQISTVSTFQ